MSMPNLNPIKGLLVAAILLAAPALGAAETTTLMLSSTAASGVTPAGMTLSAAPSMVSGWQPTATLGSSTTHWYGAAQSLNIPAGTWRVVLWTSDPGASSVMRVDLLKTGAGGASPVVLGSASLDIHATGGGNHASTFTFSLGAQTLSNQRLAVAVTRVSGLDAAVAFNGNDFPSRLERPEGMAPALAITKQPSNLTVAEGQSATFTVGASAPNGILSYQWYKGTPASRSLIPGATSASYATPVLGAGDSGSLYHVIVKSPGAISLTSFNARVTVLRRVTITKQPANVTVQAGQRATFSVAATSAAGAFTYQWYKGKAPGVAISGATAATYTTPVTTLADGGTLFYAIVKGGTGYVSATSYHARLTVTGEDPTTEVRISQLINQMSLSEKIAQLHGSDPFNTADNARLGIPGFHMADGSYGRIGGTLWPCPLATGATWDVDLARRYGAAEGKEFRSTGANVALSPMLNLLRDVRWGRSSESYGEDSFLVAELGAAQIQGIQSAKAIAEAKHFACYNSLSGMVTLSERSLRENYLFQFERAVKAGGAQVIMAAYNGVNGSACTANAHLLTDILKTEWGFQGFVNSDWGSIYDCDAAAIAGTDLAMPNFGGFETLEADVIAGRVPVSRIDDMVRRVLRVKFWAGMLDPGYSARAYSGQINSADSRAVALEIARKSIVLAKNEGRILPLSRSRATKVAILADPAPAGFGTNTGQPVTWATSYNDGYRGSTYIGDIEIPRTFTQGIEAKVAGTSVTLVTDPVQADVILYFTGIPGAGSNGIEGEGFDRTFLSIPVTAQMSATMAAHAAKTVVIISGGSGAVKGPWSAASSILVALFPGIDQAQALADILFGDVNPSGKLTVSWPQAETDVPAFDLSTQPYEEAWEGPGWHYYEAHAIDTYLEFGRGLSYTTFAYSGLSTAQTAGEVLATVTLRNTGAMPGDEVVQAYVGRSNSVVARRVKDLRGFQRVSLAPGESRTIQIRIRKDDLRYWDAGSGGWVLEPGAYTLSMGSSSKDIRLTVNFTI